MAAQLPGYLAVRQHNYTQTMSMATILNDLQTRMIWRSFSI